MTNANMKTDDQARDEDWLRQQLAVRRETNGAARWMPVSESVAVKDARALRGIGWEGDLDEMRSNRSL